MGIGLCWQEASHGEALPLTVRDHDSADHGSKHDREGECFEPQGRHVASSRKGPVFLLWERYRQRGSETTGSPPRSGKPAVQGLPAPQADLPGRPHQMLEIQRPQCEPETRTLKVPARHRLLPVRHRRKLYSFGLKRCWQVLVLSFRCNAMREVSRVQAPCAAPQAPCCRTHTLTRTRPALPPSLQQLRDVQAGITGHDVA